MRVLAVTLRRLAAAPAFTLSVIALLALGIGASGAIFSIVDAILFQRLMLPHPESLVRVFSGEPKSGDLSSSLSFPVYREYVEQSTAFAGLAGYSDGVTLALASGRETPRLVNGAVVTGNYFSVLGTRAFRGRLINPDDDAHARDVAVLSHRLWAERFGANEAILGTAIRLNGHSFTVIGITEPRFASVDLESIPEIYVPVSLAPVAMPAFRDARMFDDRQFSWLAVVGRLGNGVTMDQAQAQLRAIAGRRATKGNIDTSATLVPAARAALDLDTQGTTQRISWFLFAFVLLVLLVSGLDAGGLMLARARRRRRDLAVRLAIGASRRSIVGELFLESLLLSCAGALAGIGAAYALRAWLFGVAERKLSYPIESARSLGDTRVILFISMVAVIVALVMSLLPAWTAMRTSVVRALKDAGDVPRLRRLRVRAGDLFVVAQIALSAAILVSTGLVLRTIVNLNHVHPGFDPDHTVIASVDLSRQGYSKPQGGAMIERIVDGVKAIPGVDAAAFARIVPIQQAGMRMTMSVRGYRPPVGSNEAADLNIVTPGFFRAMGIHFMAGRDFTASDRGPERLVCIINETLARRYWPGESAIGKTFEDVGPTGTSAEVIGVVADAKYRSLRDPAPPTLYLPVAQFYNGSMTLIVRSSRPAADVLTEINRAVARLDPELPLFHAGTLRDKVRTAFLQERVIGDLFTVFGAIALLLTMAGVAGVLLYSVAARTREFGIRTAIGAQPASLRSLVLRRSGVLLIGGCTAGLLAASTLGRLTSGVLFGVAPLDPLTYAGAAALLLLSGLAAAQWPAQRAASVDPLVALREE